MMTLFKKVNAKIKLLSFALMLVMGVVITQTYQFDLETSTVSLEVIQKEAEA